MKFTVVVCAQRKGDEPGFILSHVVQVAAKDAVEAWRVALINGAVNLRCEISECCIAAMFEGFHEREFVVEGAH